MTKEDALKAMREAGKPVSAGDVTKALKEKTSFGLFFGILFTRMPCRTFCKAFFSGEDRLLWLILCCVSVY